jgi:DNA-binding NarL/FixJ family response regulator
MFYTALGWTTKQIGAKLFIETDTAQNHRQNSYVKLGIFGGAAEAVALLLITDLEFYDNVKKAVTAGKDKSNGNGRGGVQPGGFC